MKTAPKFKETDSRVKSFYRVCGERIIHSLLGSTSEPIEGIACVTSLYMEARLSNIERTGKTYRLDNLLANDGKFYPSAHVAVAELRTASDDEIEAFVQTLAERNLKIGTKTIRREYLSGLTEIEYFNDLCFIDLDAVPYRLNDDDLKRSEVESLALSDGQAFLFYHDNGFSHCGVTPTTKERFLKAVDLLIGEGYFTTDKGGVQLIRKDPAEPYAIALRIGENKGYSEVSFS